MKLLGSSDSPVCSKGAFKFTPKIQKRFFKKLIAYSVLITFTTTQVAWGQDYSSQERSVHEQTKSIHEIGTMDSAKTSGQAEQEPDSFDFLQGDSPLSVAKSSANESEDLQSKEVETKSEESIQGDTLVAYEVDRHSVEYAIEVLRSEYAAAVILESVNEKDVKELLNLDFEVAVVVLEGEIVLFSTGNEEEIGLLSPAKQILDRATFISHTHVKETAQRGPSDLDLEEAVGASEREYVLTKNGVYSYNQNGLLNRGRPVSLQNYVEALNLAKRLAPKADQVKARALLNQFIYEMDLYNEASPEMKEIFRASRTFVTVEGEHMQETGNVWMGYGSASLNGTGEVYIDREVDAGIYQIEIHAFGRKTEEDWPLMYAKVDDHLVGDGVRVEKQGGNFQRIIFDDIKLEGGVHKFAAEFVEEHANQSLVIDKIVIKKTADLPGPSYIHEGKNMLTEKGYHWAGSNSMLLWGNDRLYQNQDDMEAGVYEIEVLALGIEGNGDFPKMQAGINNKIADEPTQVTYNHSNYASYVFKDIEVEAGTNKIFAQFINDSGPRDLWIDKVIARKVSDLPEVRSVIEAEDMTIQSGWNGGHYVSVWSNGEIRKDHSISESGLYEIEVVAQGNAGGHSELPQMRVSVDGGMLTDEIGVPYTTWNYKGYKFSDIELTAGTHNFEVGILKGLSGQSIAIEKIIIRKIGEIPNEDALFKLDTISMTGDGSTWYGSNYVSMWSNGDINQNHNVMEAGVYEIEVVAQGTEGGHTELPQMRVLVDNGMIADKVGVTNNHWNYKRYKFDGVELTEGMHNFKVGIMGGLSGQNLGVQRIIFRKTGEIPNPNDRLVMEAEDMLLSGGTWNGGNYVSMWSGGNIQDDFSLTDSGVYEVEVVAHGDEGGTGVWPTMQVSLNGNELATSPQVTSNSWNYKSYKFSDIRLMPGDHSLKVNIKNWLSGQKLGAERVIIRKVSELPIHNVAVDAGQFTGSRDITSLLTGAEGYESDLEMRFAFNSTDESAYSSWEPFSSSKAVTIPNWEGTNYVNVQLRDQFGNQRFLYDTVIYDKTVPAGTVAMNGGDEYTPSGIVTINLNMTDNLSGLYKMRFRKGNSQPWTEWLDYAPTATFDNSGPQGTRWFGAEVMDRAGNIKTWLSDSIILEGTAPTGSIIVNDGDAQTTSKDVTLTLSGSDNLSGVSEMRFSTDGGTSWSGWEVFSTTKNLSLGFEGGLRTVHLALRDKAGNVATFSDDIQYNPNDMTLADGTTLHYFSTGGLVMEITPGNDRIIYDGNRRISSFRFSNDEEIHYLDTEPYALELRDNEGDFLELISIPQPTELNEDDAFKVGLDEGVDAYYLDDELVELRSHTGLRVTDLVLDNDNNIVSAFIVYPDGTIDVVRSRVLIRRVGADGTILDFTPDEFTVREIETSKDEQGNTIYDVRNFFYDKISQTELYETKIATTDGKSVVYDELGILRRATEPGSSFIYSRETIPTGAAGDDVTGYKVSLDLLGSSIPEDETMVEAIYTPEGETVQITFNDQTRIEFDDAGLIDMIFDAEGNEVDYGYLEENGFADGLHVQRGDSQFVYNEDGFLSEIQTTGGTVLRSEQDSNNDGVINEDDEIALILKSLEGTKLSDFELDSNGNIVDGIIETKEGIKQTVENGVLTGFETVDGKVYELANDQAILKEWNLKDGTRVVFGGGDISEILLANGNRLHTIGFDEDKQVSDYVEELEDGTKKYFLKTDLEGQDGLRLERIETAEGNQIFYDHKGLAVNVLLSDASEYEVVYSRHPQTNEIEEISFRAPHAHRTFNPEGTLLSLLKDGVHAEIADGEIERLFTRFGDVAASSFDNDGVLTGDIDFTDGTRLSIQDGEVLHALRPTGTLVNYNVGRVDSIQDATGTYQVLYSEIGEDITDIRLSFNDGTNTEEFLLVPYLLENPESEISDILFGRPLYDAVSDFRKVDSILSTGDTLSVVQRVEDVLRGRVYEIGNSFDPELSGVSGKTQTHNFSTDVNSAIFGGTADIYTMVANTSKMIDLNGDGLTDRVVSSGGSWSVQMNNGEGFDAPISWTGINAIGGTSVSIPNNTNSQAVTSYTSGQYFTSVDLIDMNGDGRPDRLLQLAGDDADWYVQFNNGSGFDAIELWADNLQVLNHPSNSAQYTVKVVDGGNLQPVRVDLIDLDGDGLQDRVIQPFAPQNGEHDHWFFQKNTSSGFEDAVIWEGVDSSYHSDPSIGGSLGWSDMRTGSRHQAGKLFDAVFDKGAFNSFAQSWGPHHSSFDNDNTYRVWVMSFLGAACGGDGHIQACPTAFGMDKTTTFSSKKSDLVDVNGDGKVDRLLLKHQDPGNTTSPMDWYVQMNNGSGFDAAALWDDSIRVLPYAPDQGIGSGISVYNQWQYSNYLVDLRDVTGDGLLDRVSVDSYDDVNDGFETWWVEENTGIICEGAETEDCGFKEAVAWNGIYGGDRFTSSLGQKRTMESKSFSNQFVFDGPSQGINYMSFVRDNTVTELVDINGDNVLDRVISENNSNWIVQYGTGDGFLPAENIQINGVEKSLTEDSTHSSRYDYLHVSLRAESNFPEVDGKVRVTLDDASSTETFQEWIIEDLTTDWQDFYLPLDDSKSDASNVKVTFEPTNSNLILPVHVDNISFTKLRPDATKDWLDRFLTEEEVLSEIDSESTQTLAEFLGLTKASDAAAFNWEDLLKAETLIDFDEEGEATEFTTLYGSVSEIENGVVRQTTRPDGTVITFDTPDPENPNTLTQTTTDSEGNTETIEISYGRIRSLSDDERTLEYSYEFDEEGREITVVTDPADPSGIVERYRDETVLGKLVSQLISRTSPNGVVTSFEYNELGELALSKVSYKGRIRNTFHHGKTKDGFSTVTTSEGVVEEYDSEGKIQFHTTPEGFRYAHSTVTARTAVTTYEQEVIDLPDNTQLILEIPSVSLEPCTSNCEDLRRISVSNFTSEEGEIAEYSEAVEGALGESELNGLLLQDGTRINFSRLERVEELNLETGKPEVSIKLLDATVFHTDGTITEYRDGNPYSVTTATAREISIEKEDGLLINPNESAAFHHEEALKIWNETVLPKWEAFRLPGVVPVQTEYTLEGNLVTRKFAEGTIELYDENGNHEQTLSSKGERLVFYTYDAEDNIIDINFEGPRRNLEVSELELKANVAVEKEAALAHLYEREQVVDETIEGAYIIQRDKLIAARNTILAKQKEISGIDAKGSAARDAIRGAMEQIKGALNQVNQALLDLAEQRAQALEDLDAGVEEAEEAIGDEASNAVGEIETEIKKAQDSILTQELTPIIYHWYRKLLGRDPSQEEADNLIQNADYESGAFDLAGLKQDLLNGSERADRISDIQAIQQAVKTELLDYLAGTDSEKDALLTSLGIAGEAVEITGSEAQALLDSLGVDQSEITDIHFGQSAILSLEAMLTDASIAFNRVDLATKLILIDILTGTLSPLEEGDLVISFYALRKVATLHNLDMNALAISYESLKATFEEACENQNPCDFRLIAHVNGSHYVIITGFEERVRLDSEGNPVLDENGDEIVDEFVKFLDTGIGPETNLSEIESPKAEFLKIWLDPRNPDDGFGFVLSPRPPPASEVEGEDYRVLTIDEEMAIRGADFGLSFIIGAIIATIINAVVAAVAAVVAAVQAIVAGLIAGVQAIIGGFVGAFSAGSFTAGLQSVFGGILTGLGEIAAGIFNGFIAFGTTFSEVFTAAGGFGFGGAYGSGVVQGVAGSFKVLGAKLTSLGIKGGLTGFIKTSLVGLGLQGLGSIAEAIGISPKITQTIIAGGKIIAGVGLLATGNPLGLGFIAGGTSGLLNTYTSLSPTATSLISIGAAGLGAFAGGFFDAGTLTGALEGLKSSIPALSMDFATAGVTALGNELGLDPRISSLISIPVRAGVGHFTNSLVGGQDHVLGFRDNGDPIIVTSSKGILDHFKDSINVGIKSAGISLGKVPLLGSITGGSLLSSVSDALGKEGIFKGFFNIAKSVLLAPGRIVGGIASAAQKFSNLVQNKGLGGALEQLAGSVFGRRTLESVREQGGFNNILAGSQQGVILPTGESAQEIKIGDAASLFFDGSGDLIGIREGETYRLGTFGTDSFENFGLLDGDLITSISDDSFQGTVSEGIFSGFKGTIDGIDIEGAGDNGGVFIPAPSPDPNPQSNIDFGGIFSGILKIGGAIGLTFAGDLLKDVFTIPTAEASTVILPEPFGNFTDLLINSVPKVSEKVDSKLQELKESFKWFVHYTDQAGFVGISGDKKVRKGTGAEGVFFTQDTPLGIGGVDSTTDFSRQMAERLQLSYNTSDKINPEKASHFFIVDAEELLEEPHTQRDVQIQVTKLDPDGNPQLPGVTGAKEFVYDVEFIDIAEKLIWPPVFGAISFGKNIAQNWVLAQAAIVKHFFKKAQD